MGKLKIENGKINFCCKMNNCTHSCCGPFLGITNELGSIDGRPFDEIVLTEEDYNRLYDNGYAHFIEVGYSEETGKYYHKMALNPDGSCKAWANGCCTIHDCSPTLCKAFPFYFDMFTGLCAIECEGVSDDCWVDMKEYEDQLKYARKMYEFWLDFYTKSDKEEP